MADPAGAPPEGARFSLVDLAGTDLRLCLLSCPGTRLGPAGRAASAEWLAQDAARLRAAGATSLLCLLPASEIPLGEAAHAAAFASAGLPRAVFAIPDMTAPDPARAAALTARLAALRAEMAGGGRPAIHCMAGLGRTGTLAARLAIGAGLSPDAAIAFIRARHDPAAIETADQEAHLRGLAPG
ncbi:MAG: hypothetical protein VYD87_17765 [Pseudomonadota bacterium]|nr:hypothetical protein [Pseudomonadota bacterium]MEE3098272.1 hypothetical protein [Pseudomonadota bacterium]